MIETQLAKLELGITIKLYLPITGRLQQFIPTANHVKAPDRTQRYG